MLPNSPSHRIALHDAERRFELLVEAVSEYAIFMLDVDGKVETWNRGAERINGYKENEIVGKPYAVFFTDDDRRSGKPERLLQSSKTKGKAEDEGWRVRKDGQIFWASAVLTKIVDKEGRHIGFAKVTRDLTERHAAETRLKESESRYRSIIDTARDAFVGSDKYGSIIVWNKASEELFGWTSEEVLGKKLAETIVPPKYKAAHEKGLEHFRKTGEGSILYQRLELSARYKNGREFPIELTVWPVTIGGEIAFYSFIHDLTERKRLEQMKTDFVNFASHQLKTPLAEINGFIENMIEGLTGNLNPKQMNYLKKMEEVTVNAMQLVRDLLNLSRVEQGMLTIEPVKVKLKEIAREALESYENEMKSKGLRLTVSDEQNVEVLCDFHKSVEAVKNVLHNALKFTDKGKITLRLKRGNNRGILEISDTGIGMDKELQKRLFTRELIFEDRTDQHGGSGLGLYIAKQFMTLQKGDIAVFSAPNKGTTFEFFWPKAGR